MGLGVSVCLLFALNLVVGSVHIPPGEVCAILMGGGAERESWRFIVLESRLPQAIVALLSGAALAVSGLLLQTTFRNPLAGPDVFGINGGAGLGVALVMLLYGGSVVAGSFSLTGSIAILLAAFAGAMAVTQSYHAAHCRHHGGLPVVIGHFPAQFFCHAGGGEVVSCMGDGPFWRRVNGAAPFVQRPYLVGIGMLDAAS